MPHTECSLSTKACEAGEDTKLCAVSGGTEYSRLLFLTPELNGSIALLSNAPVLLYSCRYVLDEG